ncbi:alkyl/aryl-sulfatase [Flammeovirga pectinis]|uniref:Alkyl/aryl-sulfatase n=2 Tax=Flammeovirga pectinis TaxID=2494373 RepID=A0A3Q9FU18_9BACT|nr:alkyl/aryl-sulfatase [Flammeovirga pectinis]
MMISGCDTVQSTSNTKLKEHPNITKLKNQSKEFTPDIIQLNENIYVAVGYDGSNTSMIIGEDGVIIVDALRALGAAEKVAKKFREITSKPVKALIYTHGHQDHTGGASAFIGNNKSVKIIARTGFKEELQENSPVKPILQKRNARQFGRDLPLQDIINRGVTAGVTSKDRVGKGYIKPNLTFNDSLSVSFAEVDLQLYAVNGETNDGLFVWVPSEEALFVGDNYYNAFPNLYAIRGSRYRDVQAWGIAINEMSNYPADYLIPGHTRPLSGKKTVHENLRNYGKAITFVYDKTIECMNKGYTLEQTVEAVQLPNTLKNRPNLQEFYGSVPWGVRSIFTHYVGWFDGNPTDLYPLALKEEAENIITLAGGEERLFEVLKKTINEESFQWGLQLSDYLLQINYHRKAVVQLKVKCLRGLAAQQINAPARNYYLSYAYELEEPKRN